jgi:hypothetical protein
VISFSDAAIRLLLELLDQRHPVLSGFALAEFHKTSGAELISAGLLVADGHEPVDSTQEDDDAPVALTSSDDSRWLGYFNPLSGWVSIDPTRLNRYRVDPEAVAGRLLGQTRRSSQARESSEIDEIWTLGELRVPGRRRRVSVLLLRRISDPIVWQRVRKWLLQNPTHDQRVLVCAAPADRLPDDARFTNAITSLADVIASDGAFKLEPNAIAARLDFAVAAVQPAEPLVILGDAREVRLYGRVFRFPKGETQRRIILVLYQHYLNGDHRIATATIVADLDLPAPTRLRDYFKRSKPAVMGHLLWEKGGLCGFCLNGKTA